MRPHARRGTALAALTLALTLPSGLSPAVAADDQLTIGHVQPDGDSLQILVSVPEGRDVESGTLEVTIGGVSTEASAESVGTSEEKVRRTTVLAIDTSNSMKRNGRFDAAKAAATTFLDSVPADVHVGIVTFDSDVETALSPGLDRDEARSVVDSLSLASETRLHDGVLSAVDVAGTEGQRSILVLSDGRDTSATPAAEAIAAITEAGVGIDVVALDQSGNALAPLEELADAGNGAVIPADPRSLTAAFDEEAASLSRQVLVTARIPDQVTAEEGTVTVSAGGARASSHVVIRDGSTVAATVPRTDSTDSGLRITEPVMYAGLALLGIGLVALLGGAVSGLTRKRPDPSAEARIAAYGVTGSPVAPAGPTPHRAHAGVDLAQAKDAAATVLRHNRGLEERIGQRLVAAGNALKPAEWLLLHGGITVAAGLVGALLGKGDLLVLLLFLVLGAVVPWLWLGRQRRRRLAAFNSQLADTLQLVSGSLSAGMSLAQSIDSVVKEGREPVAGEFRQALVQSRLGMPLVDALDEVATRTESKDFAWVVMAIRIQRQVGGNLTELLATVAATLREREYLRRQVSTLSAEGRLSAWILGALPVGMGLYMLFVRRDYIRPLYTEPLGILMLLAATALLSLGAFVMSRLVKVEV